MSFRILIDRLAHIDGLIYRRATGTPDQMAQKLGICRATWYEWLDQLQHDLGLPIAYNPELQTYHYTRPGRLVIRFGESPMAAADPVDDHPPQAKNKF
jgi:predicted DNA-binding transcriptional regulator YafY